MSQEIVLDIFDLGVEDTAPKKEEVKAPAAASAMPKREVKKPDPILVHGDWMIHFATESFSVADFVNEIPENGVSLEEVREGIERHFPKFSAARTRWDVDKENKRLFPDAFAGSKGAVQFEEGRFAPSFFYSVEEAIQSKQSNRFVVSEQGGIFRLSHSVVGTLVVECNEFSAEQVQQILSVMDSSKLSNVTSSFEWRLPKIPNSILRQIVQFFRAYVNNGDQFEVALRVYWDLEKETFIVDCPKQVVTPVYILFEQMEQYAGINAQRYIPVLEVHSHNIMRAFFSKTDDENEQSFHTSFGVFGVFGRLNRFDYETTFRAKYKDDSVDIPFGTLFELEGAANDVTYPMHWHENVETRKEFYL